MSDTAAIPSDRQPPAMSAPTTINLGDGLAGNMGLKGTMAQMMHTTAMAVIAGVMVFLVTIQMPAMHREAVDSIKASMESERSFYRDDRSATLKVIDRNTDALMELRDEVRKLRQAREK